MFKWKWPFSWSVDADDDFGDSYTSLEAGAPRINPATSLPMVGDDFGGVDVGGSPFGIDIHSDDDAWSSSCGDIGVDSFDDWNS